MLTLLFSFFVSLNSHAELFRNAYVSFELPQNWSCSLEATEWTCTSKFAKETKEAIIILTAKEAGPQDSLEAYEAELKNPRPLNAMPGGAPSKVVQPPKRLTLGSQIWIDSIHLSSEVPSYYTRYVATVKDRLAITVTFGAYKTHYTKYSADFLKAVNSLKTVASREILTGQAMTTSQGSNETIGPQSAGPGLIAPVGLPPEPKKDDNTLTYLAILLIVCAVGILLWRRK